MRFLLAALGFITILFLFRVDSHAACYFGEGKCPPETDHPNPAPPPTPRDPFSEATGVELGASLDDVKKRFPEGHFRVQGGKYYLDFLYTRRVDTKNGSYKNFDITLDIVRGYVDHAIVEAWADYYSSSYIDAICKTKEDVSELMDWYIELWGAPVCVEDGPHGPFQTNFYFRKGNSTAAVTTMPAIQHPSLAHRCNVSAWLDDPTTNANLNHCLAANR
jgi:hypothetical protein